MGAMINVKDMVDEPLGTTTPAAAVVRPQELPARVAHGDASPAGLTVELTRNHAYRGRALAVPGAYWSKARQAYAVDNPDARAAAAIVVLFPETLIDHPELQEIRESAYGLARPTDYATQYDLRLDVGELGDVELYDWQDVDAGYLKAIMERDGGAFVAWEPGLGKTVVTAAFIKSLSAQRTLVVARNDAKEAVWEKHLTKLLPDHDVVVLPDSTQPKQRDRVLNYVSNPTGRPRHESAAPLVLIIHYQAIRTVAGDKVVRHRDGTEDKFKGRGTGWDALGDWDLMAYDEGHRLASYNPNSTKNTIEGWALSRLRRKHVRLALNLTGSPVMNKPDDMFGQLHYLYPTIYSAKWDDWNNRYVDYVKDGQRRIAIGWRLDKLEELRRELGVFMVYRKKSEVFDLPPLIHQNIELDLLPDQRRVYDNVRDEFWSLIEGGGIKAANPMDHMNKLRQIATAWVGVGSAKLDYAVNEIEELPDAQFVVFTWYKTPGHLLAERLGEQATVVDGDVPKAVRKQRLRDHEAGKYRILIGSIETIGESLNLQYLSEGIRLDRHWNPEKNKQTLDRIYRHGQAARVNFRDLWAKDTVDTLRVWPNLTSKESLRRAVFG